MTYSDLVIEVTRRCNMACSHCLRGKAENINISDDILNAFFGKIKGSDFRSLTITGGEPSLAVDRIKAVLKYLKKYKISVGHFYMVTNAKYCPDSFLKVIFDMYMYSEEKELFEISYSNDKFHDDLNEKNIEKLSAFKFFNPKNSEDYPLDEYRLLSEGEAKENYGGNSVPLSHYDFDDDSINDGMFYLNCNGNIVPCCDLSYESQEMEELILCNVNDDFNLIALAEKWNNYIDTLEDKTVQGIEDARYEKEQEERNKRLAA